MTLSLKSSVVHHLHFQFYSPAYSVLLCFPWHFKKLLIDTVCLQNKKNQLYFKVVLWWVRLANCVFSFLCWGTYHCSWRSKIRMPVSDAMPLKLKKEQSSQVGWNPDISSNVKGGKEITEDKIKVKILACWIIYFSLFWFWEMISSPHKFILCWAGKKSQKGKWWVPVAQKCRG